MTLAQVGQFNFVPADAYEKSCITACEYFLRTYMDFGTNVGAKKPDTYKTHLFLHWPHCGAQQDPWAVAKGTIMMDISHGAQQARSCLSFCLDVRRFLRSLNDRGRHFFLSLITFFR